jgi:hypothetical protein
VEGRPAVALPLGHYEFSAFDPRMPPEASAGRQSYYDQAEPQFGLGAGPQL